MFFLQRLFLSSLVITLISSPCFSQETPGGESDDDDSLQSGSVHFEEDSPKKNLYSATQDRAIAAFQNLAAQVKDLGQGNLSPAASLDANVLGYLNAVYLYCAINQGTCPLVLQAIFEIDLINSKINNTIECPNLTQFWILWKRSDMEQRQKYLTKLGYINVANDFNTKVRPRYILCKDTIKQEGDFGGTTTEFFKLRYQGDTEPTRYFTRLVGLLEEVKQTIPNIFLTTGAQSTQDPQQQGGSYSRGGGSKPSKGARGRGQK